jgi:hypothetical protein
VDLIWQYFLKTLHRRDVSQAGHVRIGDIGQSDLAKSARSARALK